MSHAGPKLEVLLRRLVEIPPDFLDDPRIGGKGTLFVTALVNDLLRMHGARAPEAMLARFASGDARADRNRLALVAIACWLLSGEWFLTQSMAQSVLLKVLDADVAELAAATPAHDFVHDPDRREELARLLLARLGYRPAGETQAQADDRLSGLSGVERARLIEASRAAERRAREIREALVRKAAEESADKWTRE